MRRFGWKFSSPSVVEEVGEVSRSAVVVVKQ